MPTDTQRLEFFVREFVDNVSIDELSYDKAKRAYFWILDTTGKRYATFRAAIDARMPTRARA